jgi:cob(I)alamin adenosyltransferase
MTYKIYTKTGDAGETSLFGGKRLPKCDIRIEAYGTVDELNSWIGLVIDTTPEYSMKNQLIAIQSILFNIGAILATDPEKKLPVSSLLPDDVESLEKAIDVMETDLPPLKNFILPGGHVSVSNCHITRCVCRRAERAVVALSLEESVDSLVITYLNRLSDYLFVLARKTTQTVGLEEIPWRGR